MAPKGITGAQKRPASNPRDNDNVKRRKSGAPCDSGNDHDSDAVGVNVTENGDLMRFEPIDESRSLDVVRRIKATHRLFEGDEVLVTQPFITSEDSGDSLSISKAFWMREETASADDELVSQRNEVLDSKPLSMNFKPKPTYQRFKGSVNKAREITANLDRVDQIIVDMKTSGRREHDIVDAIYNMTGTSIPRKSMTSRFRRIMYELQQSTSKKIRSGEIKWTSDLDAKVLDIFQQSQQWKMQEMIDLERRRLNEAGSWMAKRERIFLGGSDIDARARHLLGLPPLPREFTGLSDPNIAKKESYAAQETLVQRTLADELVSHTGTSITAVLDTVEPNRNFGIKNKFAPELDPAEPGNSAQQLNDNDDTMEE